MKIVFSRKGFDMGSGGRPSPIMEGVPVSLPIPGSWSEPHTYQDLHHPAAGNLGPIVADLTRGRIRADAPAHADPVLPADEGPAALGQTGAAQTHLDNQGVGVGDVFVFFGLFRSTDRALPKGHPDLRPHHRIFGMMTVERILRLGESPDPQASEVRDWATHPHVIRRKNGTNNTLWLGRGQLARSASAALRLTHVDAKSPSLWRAPDWLTRHRMSYHGNEARWSDNTVQTVARGQEFVSDVGNDENAHIWLNTVHQELEKRV